MLTAGERLKLDLMRQGIEVSPTAREAITKGDRGAPLTLSDYASTSGIGLVLADDIWVNAPMQEYNPNFIARPPYRLEFDSGSFYVLPKSGDWRHAARPVPVPAYHDKTNSAGQRYDTYAITHTDRVRVSPIQGCSIACHFCDLPYSTKYHKYSVGALIEGIQAALDDPVLPARHVLISGGTPRIEDYDYENAVYAGVCAAFPGVSVDVMMMPMEGLLDPSRLKAFGVNELSVNLELHNQDIARRLMPGKWKLGRDRYLTFIEKAAEVFGAGKIRSLLMVGLEPIENTLQGVEQLCSRGCTPVLSPFRPDPMTPLRGLQPPTVETLIEVYERSHAIVARHGMHLGPACIPCHHNTLTFPDNSGYYLNS